MITNINIFKENLENLHTAVLTSDELYKIIYDFDTHELKDKDIFNRIRYFSINDFGYNTNPMFFTVLFLNNKIIGIAKCSYYMLNAHNENNYSISFFSIDKDYRGNNYARLLCDGLFKYAKENNLEISSSSYTVLGKEQLEHLFIEYANKYNVKFYNNERMHDTEDSYKIVNGKKLHISEIDNLEESIILENKYNVIKGINKTNINYTYGGVSDDGIGNFYTDNLIMSKYFAGLIEFNSNLEKYVETNNDGKIINSVITLNNPYIIESKDEDYDSIQIYFNEIEQNKNVINYKNILISKGYDGLILKNCTTNYYNDDTYNVYITFTENKNILKESKETMTFWHGGNLDDYNYNLSHKSGHWEYGPGLYLTTSYDVVDKYTKGSRKLYKVTVEKGIDLNDVYLSLNIFYDFVKSNVIGLKRKIVLESINRLQKNDTLNAEIFLNIIINNKAISNSKTNILKQFFIDNNIDYNIVDNPFGWKGKMMILFNNKKILNIKKMTSKDVIDEYDLPQTFIIKESTEHKDYLKWKRDNVTLRGISHNDTLNSPNGGMAMLGMGLYSTPLSNASMARSYGKLYFLVNGKPKNPKIFNTVNDWEIWFYNTLVFNYSKKIGKNHPDKRDFDKNTTIEAEIQNLGYDGILIKGREMVNYKPENVLYFKSENELINYYDIVIKKFNENISENLKYHIENNISITENIFRPESDAFYNLIKESRNNYNLNKIILNDNDKFLFENTDIGNFDYFNNELVPLDLPLLNTEINEALYKNKEVELNKPKRSTGPKKYKVYVKNPATNKVKVIHFGDVNGGLTAKVSDPKARKAFAARHQCHLKKDKMTAGYWACRLNRFGYLFGGKTYPGYW